MDSTSHPHMSAIRTPGDLSTGRTAMNTSSRLFEIALQATVANADAARAESVQSGSGTQHKRPSTYGSQTRSVHLTPQQWQLLNDYHEHELFVRTRNWGFCVAIFGVGLALFGCGSPAWKWIGSEKYPYTIGLWAICFPNNSTCLSLVYYLQDDWKVHTSIICFLGCACLFGILGLGLATAGPRRSALIPRLYYYHSAGECFLVSSISTASSLVLYPISASACIRNLINDGVINLSELTTAMTSTTSSITTTTAVTMTTTATVATGTEETDIVNRVQRYAYTYYLTWIAAGFFMSSFFCMNLDLLIQSFVRPVPFLSALSNYLTCCRRSHSHRRRTLTQEPQTTRNRSLSQSNSRSSANPIQPPKSNGEGNHLSSVVNDRVNVSRPTPIPEILLSSYDEEAAIEAPTGSPGRPPRFSPKSLSEDDVQFTVEEGEEDEDADMDEDYLFRQRTHVDENDDEDDADGEWI